MIKICQKCGNKNAAATGEQLEACPACKAIYSRVDAAVAAGQLVPFAQRKVQAAALQEGSPAGNNLPQTVKSAKRAKQPDRPFIEVLREGGNYPTFRGAVGIFALLGYVFAVLIAIGAVMSGSMQYTALGVAVGLFVAVICKVGKEASLMLADLSDAAVVIAEDSYNRLN